MADRLLILIFLNGAAVFNFLLLAAYCRLLHMSSELRILSAAPSSARTQPRPAELVELRYLNALVYE
jgi:hypothetical protein